MVFEAPVGGQQEGHREQQNLTRLLTPLGSADFLDIVRIVCVVLSTLDDSGQDYVRNCQKTIQTMSRNVKDT